MSEAGNIAGTGFQDPTNSNSDFNSNWFIISQFLSTVRGSALVQVKSCTNDGGLSLIGTVDVVPMVNQLDGAGNSKPHGPIPKLPYMRIQGGKNAVIIDPQPGDIGLAVFSDRDISAVKSTKAPANPGSFRRNDWADGMYVMTVVSKDVPEQYLRFFADGMEMVDKNSNRILMNVDGITLNGVLIDSDGNISGVGTLDASGEGTYNGHTVGAHQHAGGTIGSGETDPPTG